MYRIYFEYHRVTNLQWSWPVRKFGGISHHLTAILIYTPIIVSLVLTYVLCLFTMYSLVPTVYRMMGATFLSMSLITSNFYSLIVGLFFLDAKMPPFYPVAYALVIISVTTYSLAPSPTPKTELLDEENQPILE